MPSTGIRRKVDDLGRIVIPAGIRRSMDIGEGDALEVSVDGDRIVLAKPVDVCVFCGGDDELAAFRSRMVCGPCLTALGVLDGRSADAPATAEPPTPAAGSPVPPSAEAAPSARNVRDLRPPSPPDERVAGVRDERHAAYDPASSTAW